MGQRQNIHRNYLKQEQNQYIYYLSIIQKEWHQQLISKRRKMQKGITQIQHPLEIEMESFIRGVVVIGDKLRRYFFILDTGNGMLKCLKSPLTKRASKTFSLSRGYITDTQKLVRDEEGEVKCFEFMTKNNIILLIIPEIGRSMDEYTNTFYHCSQLPPPPPSSWTNLLGKGALMAVKMPWKITNLVVVSLEKISQGAKAAPRIIFRDKQTAEQKQKRALKYANKKKNQPTNIGSGLVRGTGALLKGIAMGIAGLFIEPYRGAKKGGWKGGIKGFGKGLVGLVCKPVAGAIDMITLTARGIGNTPKTVFMSLSHIIKRKKKIPKKDFVQIQPYFVKNGSHINSETEQPKSLSHTENVTPSPQTPSKRTMRPLSVEHGTTPKEKIDPTNPSMKKEKYEYVGETNNEILFLNKERVKKELMANLFEQSIPKTIDIEGIVIENFLNEKEYYRLKDIQHKQRAIFAVREKQIRHSKQKQERLNEYVTRNLEKYLEMDAEEMKKLSETYLSLVSDFGVDEIRGMGLPTPVEPYDIIGPLTLKPMESTDSDNYLHPIDPDLSDVESIEIRELDEFENEEMENYEENKEESLMSVRYITAHSGCTSSESDQSDGGLSSTSFYTVPASIQSGASKMSQKSSRRSSNISSASKVVVSQVEDAEYIRNPKSKTPPRMHSHKLRNPFHRDIATSNSSDISSELDNEKKQEIARGKMIVKKMKKHTAEGALPEEIKESEMKEEIKIEILDNKSSLEYSVMEEEKKEEMKEVKRKESEIKPKISPAAYYILLKAEKFKPLVNRKDDYRLAHVHKDGGFQLLDRVQTSLIRSIGKEIIKSIGKQILSGKLNLTTISFPIKCMKPVSFLQSFQPAMALTPLYLNRAAIVNDPVERMRCFIVANISAWHLSSSFKKPLNPILGETNTGHFADGTKLYGEQVSHRPPISSFLLVGPDNNYKMSGYIRVAAHAGLNHMRIACFGRRLITFKDGMSIRVGLPDEHFGNSLFGVIKHETKGKLEFESNILGLKAVLETGNVKKKGNDYFEGNIEIEGRIASTFYGTYGGFMDFDGQRYWDVRDEAIYKFDENDKDALASDSKFREDLIILATGDIPLAQRNKERLEVAQRRDAKMRADNEKARLTKQGGIR